MNLFELFIKIGVDDQASDKISGLSSKLGGGLATAAKIGSAAVGAAAAGITALTTAAVNNYGEYEQLVGGAELMFGNAYDFVAEKAKNAYSTVQMSQSDYLRQVNGFATGLKTALGGNAKAAAELADKIVNAEADVVAATGASQEMVQNAFNGIMRSNYVMLDNLQLGITPTKEGFQEVIDKVNEWNAANGRATNYVIDNLADAQSALVDYIEMQGLQGYAANEAADTIQGSLASLKGAYENFVTGLGDQNADIAELSTKLLESAVVVAGNLIPIIENILSSIGTMMQEQGPAMIEKFVSYAIEKLPQIIELGLKMVMSLVTGIANNFPQIVRAVFDIVSTIVETFVSSIPNIVDVGKQIVIGLWEGIKAMGSWIKDRVSGFFSGIVNGVKSVLGIHSPSKVFAAIGEYMAEGLGEGWSGEYSNIKRNIQNDLKLKTATVDFASSGLGISSSGIINGVSPAKESSAIGGPVTINLMLPDGTQFASYLLPSLISVAKAGGTPIVNPA